MGAGLACARPRFGSVRPANTMLEIGRLIGNYLVEIEAEAVVG